MPTRKSRFVYRTGTFGIGTGCRLSNTWMPLPHVRHSLKPNRQAPKTAGRDIQNIPLISVEYFSLILLEWIQELGLDSGASFEYWNLHVKRAVTIFNISSISSKHSIWEDHILYVEFRQKRDQKQVKDTEVPIHGICALRFSCSVCPP